MMLVSTSGMGQEIIINKGTRIKLSSSSDSLYMKGYYIHDPSNVTLTNRISNSGTITIDGHLLKGDSSVFRNTDDDSARLGKVIFINTLAPFELVNSARPYVPTGLNSTKPTSPIWHPGFNATILEINIGTDTLWSDYYIRYNSEVINELRFIGGSLYKKGTLQLYRDINGTDLYRGKIIGETETKRIIGANVWDASKTANVELLWQSGNRAGTDVTGIGLKTSESLNTTGSVRINRFVAGSPDSVNIVRSINRSYQIEYSGTTPTSTNRYEFSFLNAENDSNDLSKAQLFKTNNAPFSNTVGQWLGFESGKSVQNKHFYSTKLNPGTTARMVAMGDCPTIPNLNIPQTKISYCIDTIATNKDRLVLDCLNGASNGASVGYQWYKNGEPIPDSTSKTLSLKSSGGSTDAGGTGLYTVIATDNLNGCFATDTVQVYLNPKPVADFAIPGVGNPNCEGTNHVFINNSSISKGSIVKSSWQPDASPGGTPWYDSTGTADGEYTYTKNTGTINYTVRLNVFSDSGCTALKVKYFDVYTKPDVSIGTPNGTGICEDAQLVLTNTTTTTDGTNNPLSSSTWYHGDGTSNTYSSGQVSQTSNHAYNTNPSNVNESKTVKLKVVSNKGCIDSTTVNITVYPKPVASPAINLHAGARQFQICQDSGMAFSYSNAFNDASVQWNFGHDSTNIYNSGKRSINSPTGVKFRAPGTFTPKVVLTSSLNCKDSFNTSPITIHPLPVASFTAIDDTVCQGTAIQFTNTSSAPSGANSITWIYGNGQTSNTGSPSYTYPLSGVYQPKLTLITPKACKDSTDYPVRVKPNPSVSFTVANKCEDSTVAFSSTTTAIPNGTLYQPTWHWDFNHGPTNANYTAQRNAENPNVAYANYGSYTPTLYAVAEGCTSSTASKPLVIHANPVADFSSTDNCGGDTATFLNASTLAQGNYTYLWNMGDGNTYANQGTVKHVYASTQNYNIRLTATSDSNCIAYKQIVYRVYDIPTAKFDTTNATVCNLIPSQFTNQSSMKRGSALKYIWKFGDGNDTNTTNPTYTYSNPNSYNVTLLALPVDTTNICRDSITKTVIIHPNPNVQFTNVDNCLNDTFTLANQSTIAYTTMTTHFWDFGDGAKDTNNSVLTVKHHYTNLGYYTVSLKSLSDKGCLIEKKDTVRNYARPKANFDTSLASVCIFQTSQFQNSSVMSDASSMLYKWDFFHNSNTDTAKNPSFKYPSTKAQYNVKLNVRPADTTNVCRDSITKTIYLHDLPDSSFAVTRDTFCFGQTIYFVKTNAQTLHSYQWHFGDGLADSTDVTYVSKEFANPGPYTATMKAKSNFGCTSDSIVNLYVIPLPRADYTITPDSVCLGDTMQFVNTGDSISSYYVWNFSDGSTPDTNSSRFYYPKKVYSSPNSYYTQLSSVRSFQGGRFTCISKKNKWAVVHPNPVVNFSASRNSGNGKAFSFANNSYVPSGTLGSMSYNWQYGNSDSSTNSNAYHTYAYANLGQYVVNLTATTPFGCSTEDSITIKSVTVPNSAFGITDSSVCGAKSISFSNQSSNAQSFKWYFGDNSTDTAQSPQHTYTSPGKYFVQLVALDTNGYKDTSRKLIVVNAVPNAQFTASSVCAKTNVLFNNSTSILSQESISYKWYFGDGDTSLTSAPSHAYDTGGTNGVILIATSDSGCVDSATFNLTIHPNPIVDFDSALARACVGDSSNLTSMISIASGSIASRWWRIQGDPSQYATSQVKKPLGNAGAYTVTLAAQSNLGCKDSISKQVHVDLLPNITLADSQRTCGSTLNLDAGISGATYAWSTSASTQSINVSLDGNYTVTVTLASGCVASKTTKVYLNTIVNPNLGTDFAVCGDTLLDAKNPGGTYVWSNSATTRTIPITASGSYSVVVTDQNNCIGRDTIQVTRKTPPVVNLGSDTTECAGTPVTLNGGTGGDTYLWSNSSTSSSISVSSPGAYILAVTDTAANCTTRDTINVAFRYSPPVNLGADKSVCGSQSVLLNAGTFANVSYLWNNSSTSQTLSTNTSGTYWAKVTDQVKGCSRTDTIQVQIDSLPVVNLGSSRTVCAGGSSIIIAGPKTGFTYNWSTNSTDSSIIAGVSGNYSVTVTDTTTANNCSNFGNVSMTVLQVPQVSLGNDTNLCGGKTLLLQATTTGSPVQWSTNQNQAYLSVNSAGTYWATAVSGSCTSSDTIQIGVKNNPTVNLGNQSSVCGAGNLVLDAGAFGGSYKWQDNDTSRTKTINNSGLYSVIVIDSNGCQGTASLQVSVNSSPTPQLSNKSVCSGVPVFLNAGNSGSSYSWSNSSMQQAISTTTAGTYKVTITNAGGCSITDSAVVAVASPPTVNLGGNQTICSGQQVALNAQNTGSTYSWSTSDTSRILNVTNSGYYAVTVTNANGCKANDAITVSVYGYPTVNLGTDKRGCIGDTLTLQSLVTYPSGYNYLWTGATTNPSLRVANTGSYVLSVTNNFSCSKTDTIGVTISNPPSVNLGPDNTVCKDTILNAGNAGATFLWNNNANTQQITVNQSGTYIAQVSIGGCSSKDTIVMTIRPEPVVNLGTDLTTCATNPPTIDAGNIGSNYLWNTSATSKTIIPTSTGNYWSKVTNSFGCFSTDTILVTLTNGPIDSLGPDINICWDGQPLALDAGNTGSTYKWNTGARSKSINISTSSTFSVTVTDASNCADTAYIDVTLKPIPVVNFGSDRSVCDSIQLDAKNSGSTYLWSNATTNRFFKIRQSGTYWAAVTNTQSCVGTDTVQITISDGPLVNLGNDTVVCSGQELIYKANQSDVNILWSNNSVVDTFSIRAAGSYWLKLTDSSGCSNADTIAVTLGNIPGVDLGPDTTLCSNQLFPLEVDSGYATYSWNGPNNYVDSARKVDVKSSGTYKVDVVSNDGCRAIDSIKLILTYDTVKARFLMPSSAEIGDSITMVDLSSEKVTRWNWNFGDNSSSSDRDPLKRYYVEDTFRVTLTVSNATCLDRMSKSIVIKKQLKSEEQEEDKLVPDDIITILNAKVYPNPNTGAFTFEINLSEPEDFMVYFFDMRGVIMSQERFTQLTQMNKNYLFGNLSNGIYFLKVITASQQTQTFKIVIND